MRRDELLATIDKAIAEGTDYNGSAEAMVACAVAAFEYAADQVGATGFQAEWAALTAYGKELGIKCPFGVVRAEDLVYPQYDLRKQLDKWIVEWMPWAAEQAQKHLAESDSLVHPEVLAYWQRLARAAAKP